MEKKQAMNDPETTKEAGEQAAKPADAADSQSRSAERSADSDPGVADASAQWSGRPGTEQPAPSAPAGPESPGASAQWSERPGTGQPAPSAAAGPESPGASAQWSERPETEQLAPSAAESPESPEESARWSEDGQAKPPTSEEALEQWARPRGNRWEVLQTLGRGGMGVVFKCRDRDLGRTVAIKRLLTRDRRAMDRFRHEALVLEIRQRRTSSKTRTTTRASTGVFARKQGS